MTLQAQPQAKTIPKQFQSHVIMYDSKPSNRKAKRLMRLTWSKQTKNELKDIVHNYHLHRVKNKDTVYFIHDA